jgi:hypothetical protein
VIPDDCDKGGHEFTRESNTDDASEVSSTTFERGMGWKKRVEAQRMRRDFVRSHLHRSRSSAVSLSDKAAGKSSPSRPGHRPIETRLAVTKTQPEACAPDQARGPGAIRHDAARVAVPDGEDDYSTTAVDSISSIPNKVIVRRPMTGDGRGSTRGDTSVCTSSKDDASVGSSTTYYYSRREFVQRCATLKSSRRLEECAPDREAVNSISTCPTTTVKSTIEDDPNNIINTSICESDTDDASKGLSQTNSRAAVDLISSSPNTVRMLRIQVEARRMRSESVKGRLHRSRSSASASSHRSSAEDAEAQAKLSPEGNPQREGEKFCRSFAVLSKPRAIRLKPASHWQEE